MPKGGTNPVGNRDDDYRQCRRSELIGRAAAGRASEGEITAFERANAATKSG